MPINELLAELEKLPLNAQTERWNEANGITGDESLKLLADYRLTDTPRRFSERIAGLPEGEFQEVLALIIGHFPTKPYESTSYSRRVLCTVAVDAFMGRPQKTDEARDLLLSALMTVKGYELDIPTFDDFDSADRTEQVNNIDYLIKGVAGLDKGYVQPTQQQF